MIESREFCPERLKPDTLILEQMPDELMIFDPARNKAFCLNQTAAFVWENADGKTTVAELAQLMTRKAGKPVNERVVWYALKILAKDGLLVPAASELSVLPPSPPASCSKRSGWEQPPQSRW